MIFNKVEEKQYIFHTTHIIVVGGSAISLATNIFFCERISVGVYRKRSRKEMRNVFRTIDASEGRFVKMNGIYNINVDMDTGRSIITIIVLRKKVDEHGYMVFTDNNPEKAAEYYKTFLNTDQKVTGYNAEQKALCRLKEKNAYLLSGFRV